MAVKNKKGGRQHLSHEAMRRIVMGGGADPIQVWSRASQRQRDIIKRRAARQGTTIAGFIQGGPLALRELLLSLQRLGTSVDMRVEALP